MKQTIEFKKTCIMKTYVEEVTDITVTHDYKVLEDTVEGYFDIVGRYKVTRSSVTDEDFMFTVPFTIAIGDNIDKDSINLSMNDFEYSVQKDLLHLDMKLDFEYNEVAIKEEKELEPEETEDTLEDTIDEELEKINVEEETMDEINPIEEIKMDNEEEINVTLEEEQLDTKKEIDNILDGFKDENSYYKYKIYIMKEEDTLESIAIKYDVTLDTLKEYNNLEEVKVGDKIIIPTVDEK